MTYLTQLSSSYFEKLARFKIFWGQLVTPRRLLCVAGPGALDNTSSYHSRSFIFYHITNSRSFRNNVGVLYSGVQSNFKGSRVSTILWILGCVLRTFKKYLSLVLSEFRYPFNDYDLAESELCQNCKTPDFVHISSNMFIHKICSKTSPSKIIPEKLYNCW